MKYQLLPNNCKIKQIFLTTGTKTTNPHLYTHGDLNNPNTPIHKIYKIKTNTTMNILQIDNKLYHIGLINTNNTQLLHDQFTDPTGILKNHPPTKPQIGIT